MLITVKTLTDQTFTFVIEETDSISSLKSRFSSLYGVPQDMFRLIFFGKELVEDNYRLSDYKIYHESTIYCFLQMLSGMQYFVQTPEGIYYTLCSNQQTTKIKQVYSQIQDKIGITPYNYKLFFKGQYLEDEYTLAYYNINTEQCLNIIKCGSYKIFVKHFQSEKIITLDIKDALYEVKAIKAEIENKIGIPFEQQHLILNGKQLDESLTLADYNIQQNSIIYLIRTSSNSNYSEIIQLFVKTLAGKSFSLDIEKNSTVDQIKTKIQETEGIIYNQQNLFLAGRKKITKLENEKTLGQYYIQNKQYLYLVVKTNIMIQIFINLRTGKTIIINIQFNESVKHLRYLIKDQQGLLPCRYHLIFGGKYLEDQKTLADYNIQEKQTIFQVNQPMINSFQVSVLINSPKKRIIKSIMTVQASDLIENLIFKFDNKYGSQYNNYKKQIFLGEKKLENERTLEDFNITKDSILQIFVLPSYFMLKIKTFTGKQISIYVSANDSIAAIKLQLAKQINEEINKSFQEYANPQYEQVLILEKQVILEDKKKLSDYNITRFSTIHAYLALQMQIFIKTFMGETITIQTHKNTTLAEIRCQIQQLNYPDYYYSQFVFEGYSLNQNRTLAENNIKNKSTIYLFETPQSLQNYLRIFVRTLTGKLLEFDVLKTDSVLSLSEQIQYQEGICIGEQRLIFAGKLMFQNDKTLTLFDYNVLIDSTIHLVQRLRGGMQIFVKKVTGQTLTIDVEATDLIENVKAKICDKENIRWNKMNLYFNNNNLIDTLMLADYNIQKESTLYLKEKHHTSINFFENFQF